MFTNVYCTESRATLVMDHSKWPTVRHSVVPIPPQTKHQARPTPSDKPAGPLSTPVGLSVPVSSVNVLVIIRRIQSNTETGKGSTSHSTHHRSSRRQVVPVNYVYWYAQPNPQYVYISTWNRRSHNLTGLPVKSQMNCTTVLQSTEYRTVTTQCV